MATRVVRVTLCFLLLIEANISFVDASVAPKLKASHRDGKKGISQGLRATSTEQSLRRSMQEAVDEVLGSGHGFDFEVLDGIRLELEPMWASLAKNSQGRVERRLLSYAMQRYFLRKFRLSIVGLEASHANSNSTEAVLLSDYAPNYVRKVLEGETAQKGFVMEDAVGMVAALLRLLQHSNGAILETAYKARGADIRHDLGRDAIVELMEGFMLRWLFADQADEETLKPIEENNTLKEVVMGGHWRDTAHFVQGRVASFQYDRSNPKSHARRQLSTWNSLRPHFSYADVEAIAGDVALSFGSYWETQCEETLESLKEMDPTGSGRVKLSDFHGTALDGEWRFTESEEYLRQLGALDETSRWRGPRVIIANYLQSPSNCIVTTEHYRVCCVNGCEQHLSELESEIRAPTASPEMILPIVERLHYGFEEDEPKLTPALKSQLMEIARANSGVIPIHGRLFAQWLHYVFPLDCPFPHKQNTTITLSPHAFGDNGLASAEEMEMTVHKRSKFNDTGVMASEDEWMLYWSHEEELLATHLHAPWEADFSSSVLALMVIAGICMLLMKSGIISFGSDKDVLPTRMKSHYV